MKKTAKIRNLYCIRKDKDREKEQGDSWVVQRDKAGIGYGKNARPAKHEILVGKNKWVSKKEWQAAIRARKNGTATKEQKEMLDNGHWKPKK